MDGIVIRPAEPPDLPALLDIYNGYVLDAHVTFDIEPLILAERQTWFDAFSDSGKYRCLVATDGAAIAGYACSTKFKAKAGYATSIETSVYCAPDRAGKGLGTALYSALFEALRGENLHRAYAGIALPNPASIALHRKTAFQLIGIQRESGRKAGRYWDVALYERAMP